MDPAIEALVAATEIRYWGLLGIELVEAERGRVTLRLAMRPQLATRRPDVMHGGALASLVDAASGAVVATLRDPADETWAGHATTDLNISYLRAARGPVRATGRTLRAGRTAVFVGVEVEDAEGELVAMGRATYAIARRG